MSDQTTHTLEETLRERTDALPPADFAAERIIRSARRQQRRHRAYGAIGGAAAAAVVVALALQSGQVSSAPAVPAATSNPLETALTLDQAARANASHEWALALPAGPPERLALGFEVVRRGVPAISLEGDRTVRTGERVAVVLDRGEALLPEDVVAVSSPTKVADGWLFIGHRADSTGERGTDLIGSTMIHVGDDLKVRTLVEAPVVTGVLPSPDGQRAAVVTGRRSGEDQVEHDTVRFVTLDSTETVQVALPSPEASVPATWIGDRVTFAGQPSGLSSSRLDVYDLADRRWLVEQLPRMAGESPAVFLLAAPAAQGGSTSQALVALLGQQQACVHLLDGSVLAEPLVCGSNDRELVARVSPGGRYAIVGQGWNGRVNTGAAARVIDLATGADVPGVPRQLLDVGAFFLIWEDDHTLVGQATRARPVHDAATQFRWDLATSSGESLGWDPTQGPMPVQANPDVAVLL